MGGGRVHPGLDASSSKRTARVTKHHPHKNWSFEPDPKTWRGAPWDDRTPKATISSDGKKALKQLREKPSRQRSEYKTQKALHGIYRGITCLAIRREAEARYTRLLGAEAEGVGEAEAEGEEEAIPEEEEKLKELPPELWSEGPADYIQTASFGLHLRFKDEGTPGQGYLRATPNLTIRRCTTLNPATLLPTAEEGHQHNCLDEVSTKVLPRPDLNSTPQEPIQPGDYVWVKKFVRKRWNTPRWEGPYQVQLTTKTAVRVDGKLSWIHLSHCKKQKILPGEGEGAVADSP
ncbi:hypothetical protein D4764_0209360 [Takifugu flavidus]|uniref:Murine leukemia virus integrase C-terminal domain-containing protein n=1 Tax=Takifugu flavidus TaxID=433684 RepID=A0A5C6MIV3_9TELE|nr:hypothetical protein D4764_0209360 [Takifugu flavidus]